MSSVSFEPHSVLVVGAGIVGATIGWYLVRAGHRVTIVSLAGQSPVASQASFGWINASAGNPEPYARLRMQAMAEWETLASACPDLPIRRTGSLLWDMSEPDLQRFAAEHGSWGYDLRILDTEAIRAQEPWLAHPPKIAVHAPQEAAVDAEAVTIILADAARLGAILRSGSATSLLERGDSVRGLKLAGGEVLEADEVVVAAGAGSADLLATIGLKFQLVTPPGLLIHTRPHPARLNGVIVAPDLHMRQKCDGGIVAGSGFAGSDPKGDAPSVGRRLLHRLREALIDSREIELSHFTVGERPTPSSGFPMVGRPAGRPGLYMAVMHSGFTLAPAVGRFLAEEIGFGRAEPLLSPYRAETVFADAG